MLDELGVPYQLTAIASFSGRGLNDGYNIDTIYQLLRLQYNDKVILEYVELDADCDVDDVIYSQRFFLSEEPTDWEAVRHTDIFGNYEDTDIEECTI